MRNIIALSPTGSLGWEPFGEQSFGRALEELSPDFIGAQAGSADCGPLYLGSGASYAREPWVRHDLELMLLAARAKRIPLIIGGAGGFGTRAQVGRTVRMIKAIAARHNLHFRLATIQAELDTTYVLAQLERGRIAPLGSPRELTPEDVHRSSAITAMMGPEPFIAALNAGADVIVTGRCTDAAIFAAIPIREGLDPGLAWYAGKILECGCLAAFPISLTETMTARISADSVAFEPGSPDRACSVTSVAGHSMYEREDPYYQPEPGGALDLRELVLTQEDPRRVRATGARWIPAPYTLKLEGAARVGFRAISVAGVRDPIMIEQMDEVLAQVRAEVQAAYPQIRHTVVFHCFGRDGVMGRLEPLRAARPHEIGLVTQVVADTAELAEEVCDFAQHLLLHHPYPGIKATAGNLALLGSVEVFLPVHGAVYEYSVDHVMRVDDPCECFPLSVEEV